LTNVYKAFSFIVNSFYDRSSSRKLCVRGARLRPPEVLPVLVPVTSGRPDTPLLNIACALSHLSRADDDGAVKFTVRCGNLNHIRTFTRSRHVLFIWMKVTLRASLLSDSARGWWWCCCASRLSSSRSQQLLFNTN